MSTLEEWEAVAMEFYKDTGMLRPGKDSALGEYSHETRYEVFNVWRKNRKRIAELEAERDRLREALVDAIDGYQECAPYKGDYLYKKHGDDNEIARLKALLKNSRGVMTSEG